MTEQPTALRLAEIIGGDCAAELRRLHEEVTEQGRLLSMSAERELALLAKIDRLEKLNAELLKALNLMQIDCQYLHHEKNDRHLLSEPCPVEERIRAAIAKATGEQA